ncbi:MAG: alpha/beta hydrolase [Desulfohalobiaceae bacterium]|nr:alpha/beta hydrolase [Desulfohalobiaceae bacterium]
MPFALLIVAGLYLAYVLALFLLQRRLMFPGAPPVPTEAPPDTNIQRLWIETRQASCEAWFLPPSQGEPPCPAILFAHGNGERMEQWAEPFQEFTAMGLAVLLVEYPGYGRSRGKPSQKVITEVMTLAFDTLAAREDVDPKGIIAMGRSIGGGAVCCIPPEKPAALVLSSTFTSVRAFSRSFLYPSFAVRDPFDNIAALRAYSGPVLIIHGRQDGTVPVSHARALAGAAARSRLLLEDCGHNDCPPDWSGFCIQVREFLRANHVLAHQGQGE